MNKTQASEMEQGLTHGLTEESQGCRGGSGPLSRLDHT